MFLVRRYEIRNEDVIKVNEILLPTDSPIKDREIPRTKKNRIKIGIFFLINIFLTDIFYLLNRFNNNMPFHSFSLTLCRNIFEFH